MRLYLWVGMMVGCTEYGVKHALPYGSGGGDTGDDTVEDAKPAPEDDEPDPDDEDPDPDDDEPDPDDDEPDPDDDEPDPDDDEPDPDDDEPDPDDDDGPFKPSDFSLGWHLLDEGDLIPTDTNPSHVVSEHGDIDSYWYEPSGNHGLTGDGDSSEAFERMREYVLERVPEPTIGIGNLHYYADSTVSSFSEATFTYVMADFVVSESEDPYDYWLTVAAVDDGIQVIVNGTILGYLKLDEMGRDWDLGPYIRLGERNTLIVVLVDNAERNKFIQDMAFYRGEVMVVGTP